MTFPPTGRVKLNCIGWTFLSTDVWKNTARKLQIVSLCMHNEALSASCILIFACSKLTIHKYLAIETSPTVSHRPGTYIFCSRQTGAYMCTHLSQSLLLSLVISMMVCLQVAVHHLKWKPGNLIWGHFGLKWVGSQVLSYLHLQLKVLRLCCPEV